MLEVDPFSIPFQGVKTYVDNTDKIKSNNKLVKFIYLWFRSITSLTFSPLYFDKGLINLFEACCSII